jgi:hypothetical protein
MRRHLVAITLGLASAGGALTAQPNAGGALTAQANAGGALTAQANAGGAFTARPSSAPAARAQRLPHLVAGSYSGIRPRGIFFSGDSGNIVLQIKWARWTQTTAVGHGTSDIQGCVPNCADGSETPVATRVTLSRPRAGRFTEVVEVRGHTYVGHYGHSSWPEGAQR